MRKSDLLICLFMFLGLALSGCGKQKKATDKDKGSQTKKDSGKNNNNGNTETKIALPSDESLKEYKVFKGKYVNARSRFHRYGVDTFLKKLGSAFDYTIYFNDIRDDDINKQINIPKSKEKKGFFAILLDFCTNGKTEGGDLPQHKFEFQKDGSIKITPGKIESSLIGAKGGFLANVDKVFATDYASTQASANEAQFFINMMVDPKWKKALKLGKTPPKLEVIATYDNGSSTPYYTEANPNNPSADVWTWYVVGPYSARSKNVSFKVKFAEPISQPIEKRLLKFKLNSEAKGKEFEILRSQFTSKGDTSTHKIVFEVKNSHKATLIRPLLFDDSDNSHEAKGKPVVSPSKDGQTTIYTYEFAGPDAPKYVGIEYYVNYLIPIEIDFKKSPLQEIIETDFKKKPAISGTITVKNAPKDEVTLKVLYEQTNAGGQTSRKLSGKFNIHDIQTGKSPNWKGAKSSEGNFILKGMGKKLRYTVKKAPVGNYLFWMVVNNNYIIYDYTNNINYNSYFNFGDDYQKGVLMNMVLTGPNGQAVGKGYKAKFTLLDIGSKRFEVNTAPHLEVETDAGGNITIPKFRAGQYIVQLYKSQTIGSQGNLTSWVKKGKPFEIEVKEDTPFSKKVAVPE